MGLLCGLHCRSNAPCPRVVSLSSSLGASDRSADEARRRAIRNQGQYDWNFSESRHKAATVSSGGFWQPPPDTRGAAIVQEMKGAPIMKPSARARRSGELRGPVSATPPSRHVAVLSTAGEPLVGDGGVWARYLFPSFDGQAA